MTFYYVIFGMCDPYANTIGRVEINLYYFHNMLVPDTFKY